MALIDVLDHSDRIIGSISWVQGYKRRRNKSWRRSCKMWMQLVERSPEIADAVDPPKLSTTSSLGNRNGRSLRWWVIGMVRKHGVIEIASLRKLVRQNAGAGRWERLLSVLDTAINRLVATGRVRRVGSLLVSPKSVTENEAKR